MLLLLGIMGAFAVGATALVWYEISARSENATQDGKANEASAEGDSKTSDDTTASAGNAPDQFSDGTVDGDHIDELLAAAADRAASSPMDTPQPMGAATGTASAVTSTDTQAAPEKAEAAMPEPELETAEVGNPVMLDPTVRSADDMPHDTFTAPHQENVTEFHPEQDRLVVFYDDVADAFPVVGLVFDDGETGAAHVTLNGERITTVVQARGLTLDHILLVPESNLGRTLAA